MKDLLIYYCRYNLWANTKIALFFWNKSEDLLSLPIENSFPSIRKTLLHILSAERSWLARMKQDKDNNIRVIDDFSTTQELLIALQQTSAHLIAFVEKQEESFMNQVLPFSTWDGSPWKMPPKLMVQHCVNHSTYHRGQLITLARQLDMTKDLPSTDLLYFSREFPD